MSLRPTLQRAALAGALALLLAGASLASPDVTVTETTTLSVRTSTGQRETLDVPELAVGETRALSTRSGAAATVTRTEKGLSAWIAGETFDVALPDPALHGDLTALHELHALDELHEFDDIALEQAIEQSIEREAGIEGERKVVIVRKSHPGDPAPDVEALVEGDDPAIWLGDGPGKRVMLVKRVRKEATEAPAD